MIDDQLNILTQYAKTARSCRFALFNIKKIRSFLSEHASQLPVQALVLSRLDYWKSSQFYQTSTTNPEFSFKISLERAHITPLQVSVAL